MDTDKLKALALAATPGPWRECGHDRGGCSCGQIWSTEVDMPVASAERGDKEIGEIPEHIVKANAAFIAEANPATALALIAEVERLRAEVEEWLCIDCSTVYPGPPQPGFACVVCPKYNGSTGPRLAMENRLLRAAPAAGTDKDAERLADGYESGFFASDPRDGYAQFTLHYKTAAQAEAAYMLVTSIIDAAIAAKEPPCSS